MPRGSCLTLFADDDIVSISHYYINLLAKINKKNGSAKLPAHFLGGKESRCDFDLFRESNSHRGADPV
jgi:hypothetical protein